MKPSLLLTALLFVSPLICASPAVAASTIETVGFEEIRIRSEAREEDLTVLVWYPAGPGGTPLAVGENRLFRGTQAHFRAPLLEGDFPLILMSHGSGASVERMAWIAAALVKNGFVVAGPNHPGTTTGDSTPEDTPKVWQRSKDLSTVLDGLLEDPKWRKAINKKKIGGLGFSLGGAAVLRSVGATARLEAYAAYCDSYPAMADCEWYAGGRAYRDGAEIAVPPFDLRTVDRDRFERQEKDPRIRAVVAVDPAMAAAFDGASLATIDISLRFFNLGLPGTVPVAAKADDLAANAPFGSLDHVADAVHFSFLPVCTAGAKAFLKRIGETDALCEDGGRRSRDALHHELSEKIVAAFRQDLKIGE